MVMAPVRPKMTAEEFLASGLEGHELVHGEPEEVQMSVKSAWVGSEAHRQIANHALDSRLGTVFASEMQLKVWPDDPNHSRKPDVSFVSRGRIPAGALDQGYLTVVPDLIVEVVSPNDEAGKLRVKLADYKRAGVPLIWVIYPETRDAEVHRPGQPIEEIPRDGVLHGEGVLPGFTLSLAALFAAAEAIH